jgi:protein-S-isoprenylcysteine O-methyltransferase Ste14
METTMRRIVIGLISFISVTLYLALAVWGEGGLAAFTAKPALVWLAGVSYALAVAAPFTQGSISSGEREDRGNRWVLIAFSLIGLADGFAPAWSDRTGVWVIGGEAVRWIGVALYLAGGVLRMAPVFVLGRRFSGLVAIQPGHELVTDGIYALVRNPSYVGLLVLTLGWALAFRSWVGVILTVLMLPPLIARMTSEERLLASQFGQPYQAYKARTWRLIPWVY